FIHTVANFHATSLATAAGVHLSLDHPTLSAQGVRGGNGFVGAAGHLALSRRYAVTREDFLGLIFMYVHRTASCLCLRPQLPAYRSAYWPSNDHVTQHAWLPSR